MQKKRRKLSDIKGILSRINREHNLSPEVADLVEEDICAGLDEADVLKYCTKKIPIEKMRIISACIYAGADDEVIERLSKYEIDSSELDNVLTFIGEGVPLGMIEDWLAKDVEDRFIKLSEACRSYIKSQEEKAKEKAKEEAVNDTEAGSDGTAPEEKSDDDSEAAVKQVIGLSDETIKIFGNLNKTMLDMQRQFAEMQGRTDRKSDIDRTEYERKIQELESEIEEKSLKISEYQAKEAQKKKFEAEEEGHKEEAKVEDTLEEKDSGDRVTGKEEPVVIQEIPVSYAAVVMDGRGRVGSVQPIDTMRRHHKGIAALGAAIGFKKKSRRDMLNMVLDGELCAPQLIQIRHGIELGLTEDQLCTIIKSRCDAETMKEVVEMAALQNRKGY